MLAHELSPHLLRQIFEPDVLGRQVGLEALEAAKEVAVELLLQEPEPRLVGLAVTRAQAKDEAVDGRAQVMKPGLAVARWRLVGRDLDPALERLERGGDTVDVERQRPAHAHGSDDGREVSDDLPLVVLVGGDHQQRGIDFRHR